MIYWLVNSSISWKLIAKEALTDLMSELGHNGILNSKIKDLPLLVRVILGRIITVWIDMFCISHVCSVVSRNCLQVRLIQACNWGVRTSDVFILLLNLMVQYLKACMVWNCCFHFSSRKFCFFILYVGNQYLWIQQEPHIHKIFKTVSNYGFNTVVYSLFNRL
jgi:hypothetical protein